MFKVFSVVALFLMVSFFSLAFGQQYSVQIIGQPISIAQAINEQDVAAGYTFSGHYCSRATVWFPDGQFQELPVDFSEVFDIDNNNLAVGQVGDQAFAWQLGGAFEILPLLVNNDLGSPIGQRAYAVDNGIAVGHAGYSVGGSVFYRAVLWQKVGGAWQATELPPLPGHNQSIAYGISGAMAVGRSQLGPVIVPVKWNITTGQATQLIPAMGFSCGQAKAIDCARVVGESFNSSLEEANITLWILNQGVNISRNDKGTYRFALVQDISGNTVVGRAYDNLGYSFGAIWNGPRYLFNNLNGLTIQSPGIVRFANGINSSGKICGAIEVEGEIMACVLIPSQLAPPATRNLVATWGSIKK